MSFILDASIVTTECDRCGMPMWVRLEQNKSGRWRRAPTQHCEDCVGMGYRIAKVTQSRRRTLKQQAARRMTA